MNPTGLKVIETIHHHDSMFNLNKDLRAYLHTGAAALRALQAAISLADLEIPRSILDFGCGHGRVGRWLRAAYPDAELTGAELAQPAVDFYAETFRAKGWKTSTTLEENIPGRTFDLIWAGSVVTHMPEESVRLLIMQFISWISKDGLAVFSSHGRVGTKVLRDRGGPTMTDPGAHLSAFEDFDAGKFGFVPYTGQNTYGTSFVPPKWFVELVAEDPSIRLVMLSEAGWRGNQDVIAIQKKPAVYVPPRTGVTHASDS